MFAGIDATDNRVKNAGGTIDNIERRMKALFDNFPRCDFVGVLIGYPTGIDAIHVNAVAVIIGGGGAGHHVEGCLRHVRVGVPGGLPIPVELAFHGGDVDDVFVASRAGDHQRL